MMMRVVRVVLAPGKTDEYWSWAREIVRLWDSFGVQRAGGPYATKGPGGEDVAIWLTVHADQDSIRDEFRQMYAEGVGRELIERRPPLVAETTSTVHVDWDPDGPEVAPASPAW